MAMLVPYCKLIVWLLTGYCILQNVSQIWFPVFTHNRLKHNQNFQHIKKYPHVLQTVTFLDNTSTTTK